MGAFGVGGAIHDGSVDKAHHLFVHSDCLGSARIVWIGEFFTLIYLIFKKIHKIPSAAFHGAIKFRQI
jgi:hypothetical protein